MYGAKASRYLGVSAVLAWPTCSSCMTAMAWMASSSIVSMMVCADAACAWRCSVLPTAPTCMPGHGLQGANVHARAYGLQGANVHARAWSTRRQRACQGMVYKAPTCMPGHGLQGANVHARAWSTRRQRACQAYGLQGILSRVRTCVGLHVVMFAEHVFTFFRHTHV
jgi:hypothetical protein